MTLEQVHGAITYCLAYRDEVNHYVKDRRQDFAVARQPAVDADPTFHKKLADAKKRRRLTPGGSAAS